MHSSTVDSDRRREATPANGTGRACPGSVVVERGRTGTRARAGRSTPRRPGAALGNVPALTGGGGSRLARVLARPLPARSLSRYGLMRTCSRICGASLTRGVGSGQARACPPPLSVARVFNVQVNSIILQYSTYCTVELLWSARAVPCRGTVAHRG